VSGANGRSAHKTIDVAAHNLVANAIEHAPMNTRMEQGAES
jgi:hypothetical protein